MNNSLFYMAILAGATFFYGNLAACSKRDRTLVILHTSDEHSHLLGFAPERDDYPIAATTEDGALRGGIARRAAIFEEERRKAAATGAAVVALSSGDNLMGTLFQAAAPALAPDYRAMKVAGYDALTFGNHEFDFGPAALASAIEAAKRREGMVPVVATNLHLPAGDPRTQALSALFDSTGSDASKTIRRWRVLTTSNGLRIGLVGLVGASAARDAPNKAPATFSLPDGPLASEADFPGVLAKICAETQAAVDHLRQVEKVDLVVALGHAGLNPENPAQGESVIIAEKVRGLDVFLSGHTHLLAHPMTKLPSGKAVIVEEPGRYGENVTKLILAVSSKGAVRLAGWEEIPVGGARPVAPALKRIIDEAVVFLEGGRDAGQPSLLERMLSAIEGAPVADEAERSGDLFFRQLGRTSFDAPLVRRRESGPLRLVADATLAAAERFGGPTQLAIAAAGAVRDGLWRGKTGRLAFADVFRVMPLGLSPIDRTVGYPIVRLATRLGALKVMAEQTASVAYSSVEAADFFLIAAGARFAYDTGRAPFDGRADLFNPGNGRVTRIWLAEDHSRLDDGERLVFDAARGEKAWLADPKTPLVLAMDYYLAIFAVAQGLPLAALDGTPLTTRNLAQTVVHRPDGSDVKSVEALGWFIRERCRANGGQLPESYGNSRAATRAICSGPLCHQPK